MPKQFFRLYLMILFLMLASISKSNDNPIRIGVILPLSGELAMEAEAKKMRFTGAAGLFSTHPPTFKRILQLKEMENEVR